MGGTTMKKKGPLLTEKPFPYDYKEYQRWTNGDEKLINKLIKICGNLCRGSDTYINQSVDKQYYPEVLHAVYLVKNGLFPKDNIIFENFTLSYKEIMQRIKGTGVQAEGAKLIYEVFSDAFLQEFDRLYDLNKDKIINSNNKRITLGGWHVDLCAINPETRQVLICEVKRYDFGGESQDKLYPHQHYYLSFVHNISNKWKRKSFKNKTYYDVQTELVVYVPKKDLPQFKPSQYDSLIIEL
jgi:hypothetical protein